MRMMWKVITISPAYMRCLAASRQLGGRSQSTTGPACRQSAAATVKDFPCGCAGRQGAHAVQLSRLGAAVKEAMTALVPRSVAVPVTVTEVRLFYMDLFDVFGLNIC